MIKIVDNFLDHSIYKNISDEISSEYFPWYFNYAKVGNLDYDVFNYQLIHGFYSNYRVNSGYFELLDPLIAQIGVKSLIRVKANLNPPTKEIVIGGEHVDQDFSCKAAIYYVNTNDGYTLIGDQKIESKANRIVFFDANTPHSGSNCTNIKNRIIINLNYF
tara:strand:- start:289 stop:771 length:483 start_codon:yes stop_codon:yes gene_type:complete